MSDLHWEAPEFLYHHKSVHWYWTSILVAVTLFALALWQKNFLFAVFVFCAEFIVLQYGNQYPKTIAFKISPEGIAAGKQKVYSYETLESFSLNEEFGEFSELVLKFKSRLSPLVKIHIRTGDIPEVRTALQDHLVETVHEESVFDALGKIIGF